MHVEIDCSKRHLVSPVVRASNVRGLLGIIIIIIIIV